MLFVISISAAVIGLAAGLIGRNTAKIQNSQQMRLCGVLSIVMIILFCTMMVLSDGHTNPHAWILLGSTSIIPGAFGGAALRLASKGWKAILN